MGSILLVDDEEKILKTLGRALRDDGHEVVTAANGRDAQRLLAGRSFDLLIIDFLMPDRTGMDVLRELAGSTPEAERPAVVMMTAHGSIENAVEAMKLGARDYLQKPFEVDELLVLTRRALEDQRARTGLRYLLSERDAEFNHYGIIGKSRAILDVIARAELVAESKSTVLITGETGTGKELVARAIHARSAQRAMPMIKVNCAAIPETLLESEIFGHEKGAFTGAADRRQGCFELADRGTLFLDEIGEMTPATQVKLLRVLQERKFRRLGGRAEQSVDVRVIAATNIEPLEAVQNGKLREDLYYRLNVFNLRLPPLRERREDLPLLIQAFITEFNVRNQKSIAGVDHQVMRMFEQHTWPGNVRELRNVIERATILAPGPMIEARHMPSAFLSEPPPPPQIPSMALVPGTTVEEAERRLILMTLTHTGDNKTRAAEILGISLKTLHNKLNKLRLRPKRSDA
jgi:DNA-binding NtrC family response regulator